ncbi:MAG: aminoacyl-tRNA hydrolase, partial [Patescibacteria group bacterium]|nr:aminoacyl-tRNA hydrolase [Patescibacteria group bacterium]
GMVDGVKVMLAKPQTFMNNSGLAASKLARFYKIKKEDILIIYDDIDMVAGTLRLRHEGSDGGHRGLRSILQSLKSEKIARLKIGIAEKKGGKQRVSSEDYVLKPPSTSANGLIKKSLALVPEAVERWLNGEAAATLSA